MQTLLFAKMQFACLIILSFVFIQHRKERYLPMSSSLLFKRLYTVAVVSLIFDGITAVMINTPSLRDLIWDRIAHFVFIASIDIFAYVLCSYICSLIPVKSLFTRTKKILRMIPLMSSIFILSFCFAFPELLTYNTEGTISFSEGLCADTVYFSVAIYMIIDIYYLIKYRTHLSHSHKKALVPAFLAMVIISVSQLFNHEILISGLGTTLVVLGLYLALEDKNLVYNPTLKMFNASGFYRVYGDLIAKGKMPSLVMLSIYNKASSTGILIRDEENEQTRKISEALFEAHNIALFDVFPTHPIFFMPSNISIEKIHKTISSVVGSPDDATITLKCFDSFLCTQNANDVMLYAQHYIEEYERDIALFDIMTGTKNKNAFINEIKYCDSTPELRENLWFVMVDVNGLKNVNDSLGHMYGDKAIIYTAKALKKAFDNTKEIYRIGGDEFVIVLKTTSERSIQEGINNAKSHIKRLSAQDRFNASFSAGFAKFDSTKDKSVQGTIARADKAMYEQKYEYHKIIL